MNASHLNAKQYKHKTYEAQFFFLLKDSLMILGFCAL